MISSAVNITHDLTPNKEKPLWPLSSYGPSKHEPLLLAGLDESPEELRVKAFTALKAGNINEYVSQATISLYDTLLTSS
jgi:nucleoporin NUP42